MAEMINLRSLLILFLFFSTSTFARELKLVNHHHQLQTLTLSEDLSPTKKQTLSSAQAFWSLQITHRNAMDSPFKQEDTSMEELISERLKRDAARVEAIYARVQLARKEVKNSDLMPTEASKEVSEEDFSSPIVSGLSQGSGEYFTRLGVGTPAKELYLVLDTGSDLSWIQCSPCGSCYQQADPIFSPTVSSSFQPVSCSQHLCSELQVRGCQNNACLYQVSYGDGSFTVGNFVKETISFGRNSIKGIGIGCGHDNEGLFVGAAGLLGLGGGTLSFPSQVSSAIKGKFSYCLADREQGGSSSLLFGDGAVPSGASMAPLLKNPKLDTFYYVSLRGISVGGNMLAITEEDFSLASSGQGGVIIDSGTSVTRLVNSAYVKLRDAFKEGTQDLPSAPAFSLFDTCYNLQGKDSVDVPTVDLHFEGGSSVKLPAANYLVAVDTAGTYCLAFSPTQGDISIIGNLQQQGFRVSFDSATSQIGFTPDQC